MNINSVGMRPTVLLGIWQIIEKIGINNCYKYSNQHNSRIANKRYNSLNLPTSVQRESFNQFNSRKFKKTGYSSTVLLIACRKVFWWSSGRIRIIRHESLFLLTKKINDFKQVFSLGLLWLKIYIHKNHNSLINVNLLFFNLAVLIKNR